MRIKLIRGECRPGRERFDEVVDGLAAECDLSIVEHLVAQPEAETPRPHATVLDMPIDRHRGEWLHIG
jgi:hypothetical protein